MNLTIIVATDRTGGIGIDNRLPWRLPEDLAHFKRLTIGHPIVMGRKTFESIGRPLPGRRNIVISRNLEWRRAGTETAFSLLEALHLIGDAHAFIIGGAQIYAQALPLCERLIVTEIDKVFGCDAFFPARDAAEWHECARQTSYSGQNECNFAFVTYQRRAHPPS
ncbi:MAG: dihydrofolate reductase [Burkholderiaceae bacterium]